MSVDIQELIAEPTEEEIEESIYDRLEDLDLPVSSWSPLDPLRTVVAIVAAMLVTFLVTIAKLARSGFLELAEGDWLTILARDNYNVTRIGATFASGNVTLDNTGGGIFAFDLEQVVFKNTTTGKVYTNTAAFTLNALQTGVLVPVRALESGAASNAAPGEIDDFETTMLGVTVTNNAALAGQDEESDADLRQRCRDALGLLSACGPKAAYEFVCKTPSLNGGVQVRDVYFPPPIGNGAFSIVVAGPDGAIGDVSPIQSGVDTHAKPLLNGVPTVLSAVNAPQTLEFDVFVRGSAGLSDSEWDDLIRPVVLAHVNALPIGGVRLTPGATGMVLWRSIAQRIDAVSPDVLQVVAVPEADVAVGIVEVPTLATGDLTLNITQV